MPLTPAHPAAVLPLRRLGLPMSALVAGAVAPDAVLFTAGRGYSFTHSAVGVVSIDVVLALGVLAAWFAVFRDPLADLTPYVRDRVPRHARPGRRDWVLSPVAAVVGAATHVLWDSGTHDGRWLVAHVALLRQDLGPLPGYAWAQLLSTGVGTLVVVAYSAAWLRRRPVQPHACLVRRPVWWLAVTPAAGLLVGLVASTVAAPEERVAYAVAGMLQGTTAVGLVGALAWLRVSRRSPAV